MAISIKNIPVLEGATAEEFIRHADRNSQKAIPKLSSNSQQRLANVLKKSKSFKF